MALRQQAQGNTQARSTDFSSREKCLQQIATMSDQTLRILAELSIRPGVEQKLKDKEGMIKLFL